MEGSYTFPFEKKELYHFNEVLIIALFPNPKYVIKVHVTLLLSDVPGSHSTYPPWTERWIFSVGNVCKMVYKNLFCGRISNPIPATPNLYISGVCALLTIR